MKTVKMLAILVFALGLMVWSAEVSEAAPMGTAWTYQGRLMDANFPADGLYDFEFKLYYVPTDANQVGSTVDVNDLDVIDGYFTAELNFGSSVFDGNSVWLQIDVRPGDSNDPNAFVTLSPRQEVTPTPYALQTRGIFVDKAKNVGIGTTTPEGKLHVDGGKTKFGFRGTDITIEAQDGGDGGGLMGDNGGNGGNIILLPGEGGEPRGLGHPGRPGAVGIGTDKPGATLDVRGNIKITGGSPDAGKVLISDASGLASWQNLTVIGDGDWTVSGSDMYSIPTGNVGIHEGSPLTTLHVQGTDRALPADALWGDDIIAEDYTATLGLYSDNRASHGSCITLGEFVGDTGTLTNKWGIYRMTGPSPALQFSFGTERNFTANPTLLTITAGGKLGIGTTAPTANLDVKSTSSNSDVIKAIASDDSELFNLSEISTGDGVMYLRNRDGTWKIRLSSYGYSLFNGGNVGIGNVGVPLEKLVVRGNILVKSESTGADVLELGEGLDYAEGFDVTEEADIEAGTVLVIDSDNPGKLTASRSAYDSKVAGIVAGANGIGSGVRLGVGQFDHDVALAGRVYCKVDTTEAPVQPGDLLTTSGTAGYAMKAADYDRARGAILGKAMQSLEKGQKGQILVLVTLQ